ncbi:MAG: threonine/serine dehydratase [candidate division KSB1 bacterium]|nr:threonine/serine dehydratase [candidate division KSB1 bacterium]MDQ7063425.1 threonine/serine dehydratase [candidate division KSB1 bacterium]
MLTFSDILQAHRRIRAFVHATPLLPSAFWPGLHFKMECWQKTGSFKIRGALNAVLALSPQDKRPLVAASAGNHGLGVAFAAQKLRRRVIIFVPKSVSPAKLNALQAMGVQVQLGGRDYDEAEALALQFAAQKGYPFVHAFAAPEVIAGQGTVGLEIAEVLPEVQAVVVPIGGGGLISGVALAIKTLLPGVRVIGVQSEASPAMHAALQAGRVVETPVQPSLADGLAGRFVHETTLALTQRYVDEVVLVSEASIAQAMHLLLARHKWVVEGSAAVGLAAWLEGSIPSAGTCAMILTGGNVSTAVIDGLLQKYAREGEMTTQEASS